MRAGVGRYQRTELEPRDVPEPGFVQVADVDEDAERRAAAHESLAGVGEARSGVGTGGEDERHAVTEGVRPAPHGA